MNKPHIPWNSPDLKKKWEVWLEEKYGNMSNAKKRWKEFGEVKGLISENKNLYNSPQLYDYQIFKSHIGKK